MLIVALNFPSFTKTITTFYIQAKQHLDQFKVGGKNLTLSYSKIRSLLANKLIEEDGLQKQYLNSR